MGLSLAAAVARLLARIVTDPRPRLRYTTGPMPERAAIWLKRLAPYAIIEKLMAKRKWSLQHIVLLYTRFGG